MARLKVNPSNPRSITPAKQKRLADTMERLGDIGGIILNIRTGTLIGGNQRTTVIGEVEPVIEKRFKKPNATGTIAYGYVEHGGERFSYREVDWPEELEREAIIAANVEAGSWDLDKLYADWDKGLLKKWGLELPELRQTEILSELTYDSVYYEPKERPNLKLADCFDLTKYEAKMEALQALGLSKKQIDLLRVFCYRFIRIDFQRVAEYYAFNATEKERLAIERLRLVLVDNGVQGFIEDDLLKVISITDDTDA